VAASIPLQSLAVNRAGNDLPEDRFPGSESHRDRRFAAWIPLKVCSAIDAESGRERRAGWLVFDRGFALAADAARYVPGRGHLARSRFGAKIAGLM